MSKPESAPEFERRLMATWSDLGLSHGPHRIRLIEERDDAIRAEAAREERERCCRDACILCRSPELWLPARRRELIGGAQWYHASKTPARFDGFCQATALRERAKEGREEARR